MSKSCDTMGIVEHEAIKENAKLEADLAIMRAMARVTR